MNYSLRAVPSNIRICYGSRSPEGDCHGNEAMGICAGGGEGGRGRGGDCHGNEAMGIYAGGCEEEEGRRRRRRRRRSDFHLKSNNPSLRGGEQNGRKNNLAHNASSGEVGWWGHAVAYRNFPNPKERRPRGYRHSACLQM